jgi:TolB-like protein
MPAARRGALHRQFDGSTHDDHSSGPVDSRCGSGVTDSMKDFKIQLLGPLSIIDANGTECTPKSKKAQALLAMLCTARNGRRTRAWLQANLWSNSAASQASGSLRNSLHELRTIIGHEILTSDRSVAQIDLTRLDIDLKSLSSLDWLNSVSAGSEFLEGIDIIDDAFNAWLQEQRQYWSQRAEMQNNTVVEASPEPEPLSLIAPSSELPDWSLSLTVLPLENKSGDESNLYACHGLSEDLIQNLQRLRWLPVVGSAASFVFNNHNGSQGAAIADGMGAHYFVDGALSLQNNARVGYFRLCEAETARVIWSEGYDLEPLLAGNGISSVFDEIVSAIERSVAISMQRRVMESDNRDEAFNDQIWRGRWHLARLTKQDSELAHRHFAQALTLKRHSSEALVQMAFWHLWKTWVSRDDESGLHMAETFARQAVELDPDDGRCYAVIGIAEAWRRNHESAIGFLSQAVELNPNLAIAYHQLGSALNHADRPEDAVMPIRQAIKYSPRDQLDFAFQTEMAVALARLSDYEEAYVRASRALMLKPRYWYAHLVRLLIAHRLEDGARIEEARHAFDQNGVRVGPEQIDWLPFRSDDWPNQLREIADD